MLKKTQVWITEGDLDVLESCMGYLCAYDRLQGDYVGLTIDDLQSIINDIVDQMEEE